MAANKSIDHRKDQQDVHVDEPIARPDSETGYFSNIEDIRRQEYPLLQDTTYLDHGGTTLYAQSLVDAISHQLKSTLFGNPHSHSASSQQSTSTMEAVRLQVLHLLKADPEHFDLIFVPNATAAIKLVGDAFRDCGEGFWYGYHVDCHTSAVGVRELASLGSKCFNDGDFDQCLSYLEAWDRPMGPHTLFAFPGQSNLSGNRPPLDWCARVSKLREERKLSVFTLLDAAALLSTAPLDLSDHFTAPDFTAFSFYKMFGLPDLGALVVKRECSHVFDKRKYFGGGTVDMVVAFGDPWAARKDSLHERLEDGTPPFHSIAALGCALKVHESVYGSFKAISRHVAFLARYTHQKLRALKHSNGVRVCELYGPDEPAFGTRQGPIIALNLRDARGEWIGKSEVEKLAAVRNIQLRTGGHCNPGGIATHLGMSPEQFKNNFAAGVRCGNENDIVDGTPTGVVRISFSAMSSMADANAFITLVEDFFVQVPLPLMTPPVTPPPGLAEPGLRVKALSLYPIKSCAAMEVPRSVRWKVNKAGLAWDREWCLVHQGTGIALSQKRYPHMATLRPSVDIQRQILKVSHAPPDKPPRYIEIDLGAVGEKRIATQFCSVSYTDTHSIRVCGQSQDVHIYLSPVVSEFFSSALEVPCTLARHQPPPNPRSRSCNGSLSHSPSRRHSMPGHFPSTPSPPPAVPVERVQHLANESPILLINQASVSAVSAAIQASDPTAVELSSSTFRANIVVGTGHDGPIGEPFAEETWASVRTVRPDNLVEGPRTTRSSGFDVQGPCQRCQMVCIDQQTGEKGQEPLSTLAKLRRRNGKVYFGVHLRPRLTGEGTADVAVDEDEELADIGVGDVVYVS